MPQSPCPRTSDELALSGWGARLPPAAIDALCARFVRVELEEGEVLLREGDPGDTLYLVTEGRLLVRCRTEAGTDLHIGEAGAGDLVGEQSLVEGSPRAATVEAVERTVLLALAGPDFREIAARHPEVLAELRALITRRAQAPGARRYRPETRWILDFLRGLRLFRGLDDATLREIERRLRWAPIFAGDTLMRQGDPADATYLVVTGRLRVSVTLPDGTEAVLRELRSGEIVGEMALISDDVRSATVQAIRDCELLALRKDELIELARRHPSTLFGMLKLLADRLRRANPDRRERPAVANIAILPLGDPAAAHAFATRLARALAGPRAVEHLTSARHEAARLDPAELGRLEEADRLALYEADPEPGLWSRFCLRQADLVLLVGVAGPPPPRRLDELLAERLALAAPPRVELVLLHEEVALPSGTAAWLDRFPVGGHHHVRLDRDNDLARLARLLTGQGVAVVLSGGGARGFAHIGALRALDEAGVPIDAIAGTSMGSVIAAQRALGWGWERMLEENREGWVRARPMSDYTLPFVAVLSGRKFFAMLERMFGGPNIEDLWLPCFFTAANMNRSRSTYATRGELWRWITASVGIPGLGPPRILGGDFHCDGGVLDNLPVAHMREHVDARVLALDVSQGGFPAPPAGVSEFPSTWKQVRRSLGDTSVVTMPNIFDILFRSATMAAEREAERARAAADLCIEPPVYDFPTFRFDAIDEIARIGYEHTRAFLASRAELWPRQA